MAKQQDYGFKTPKRRETKNITGFKVGGDLTGGECKILKSNQIIVDKELKQSITISDGNAIQLFNSDLAIFAMGGYFYSESDFSIIFEISHDGKTVNKERHSETKSFLKMGLDLSIPFSKCSSRKNITATITIKSKSKITLNYWLFDSNFIDYDHFQKNDVYSHYNNSKKWICFPEQFYSTQNALLKGSQKGIPFVLKSCNRCQRFLPINHLNERSHLSFTNHCSTKAPCTHSNFSNYRIVKTDLTTQELSDFVNNDTVFSIKEDFLRSHYGHQLECKACKKFFVNSALNSQRTSSQHREDSLRRRAFEGLILKLINQDSIYHSYRINNKNKEFDRSIWEKFGKKCFKCKKDLESPKKMDLDHTMPLVFLYNLDETSTCLCKSCNSGKSDSFPVDFYTHDELLELSKIVGLPISVLMSRKPNQIVVNLLQQNIVWFFEEFLAFDEFHKEREGKKAVDSICHSLQKVINKSNTPFDLNEEYKKAKSIK